MATETYYYFFSIIGMLGLIQYLVATIYLRAKRKTLSGRTLNPGSVGYENVKRLTSVRGLVIPILLGLGLAVNLAYSTVRVARIGTSDAYFILVFAPIATMLLFWAVLNIARKNLRGEKSKVRAKKSSNED
jgi:cytochrome c biogenesis factor